MRTVSAGPNCTPSRAHLTKPNPACCARPLTVLVQLCLVVLLVLPPAGCAVLGVAANALPEPDIAARYADLRGHSVAVMVWADRGVLIDYPSLRLDVAAGLQSKLQQAKRSKGELKDVRFPYVPASVVRFQEDHPEVQDQTITEVAPRLNVERLIYVEVDHLQTRADDAIDLFRGEATASIKVIAVDPATGRTTTAYEESGIVASFPPTGPPEGLPGVGDARIYGGLVDRLTTILAVRFFSHPAD